MKTKQRKVIFSFEQINGLTQAFNHQHYFKKKDVMELALTLNLTPKQVRVWMQNQRYRRKKLIRKGGFVSCSSNVPTIGFPIYPIDYTKYSTLQSMKFYNYNNPHFLYQAFHPHISAAQVHGFNESLPPKTLSTNVNSAFRVVSNLSAQCTGEQNDPQYF